MYTQTININLEKIDDIVKLEDFTDMHIGDKKCNEGLIEKRLRAVNDDEMRFIFLGGDNIDCIFPEGNDKRFNSDTCNPKLLTLAKQIARLDKLFAETFVENDRFKRVYDCPKIWGAHWGNHEWNSGLINEDDMRAFCKTRGIKFMGARCMTRLNIIHKDKTVMKKDIYSAHGAGGGANALKALDDMSDSVYADVFIMGHLHQQAAKRHLVQFYNEKKQRWDIRRILKVNAGCFTDSLELGKDSWLEHKKNKLVLTEAGTVTVTFDAYKQKIAFHM